MRPPVLPQQDSPIGVQFNWGADQQAAAAYERALSEPEADLETHLNLALVYFQSVDPGYAAHHHLSASFVERAEQRFHEVLDRARDRFPDHGEIDFWRLYYGFAHLGANDFTDEAKAIIGRSSTLAPYFYLYTRPDGNRYRAQAERLFNAVRDRRTARQRYIASVLEKRLHGPRIG